jgi:hypothetical protein
MEHDDPDDLLLFFAASPLVAICFSHLLLNKHPPVPTTGLVRSDAARNPDFPSHYMPEYIKLKKTPTRDLMSVFMAADELHRRLGPLDTVTAAIVL